MKLTIEKAALHRAISRAVSVVERRNTIPILSNVLIQAFDDGVWLTATDLDIEVRARVEGRVEIGGAVTAPAGLLSDIVRNAPDGAEISLAWDADADPRMIVKFGRSRYQVPVLHAGDFPVQAPLDWTASVAVQAVDLRQAIARVDFAMSTDPTRYYLNGALLQPLGDRLRLVATDGHRLCWADLAVPAGTPPFEDVIIPSKTVREMGRALAEAAGEVSLEVARTGVRLSVGDHLIRSKVVDGKFADYPRVIPAEWLNDILLPREPLAAAVRRVGLMSDDKSRSLKMTFTRDLLTLQVRNMEAGNAVEELEIDYPHEDFEIGFNARYLVDALGMTGADRVIFRPTDPAGPARLEPEPDDAEHGQTLAILMPLRV